MAMQKQSGGIEPATAVRLGDLVEYQQGSIVSRTIANAPVGTLTMFAFDEGQALSEHSAPYDAYVTVQDGTAELVIGGVAVMCAAGQTVRMPANVPHAVNARQRFKMLLTMIRG
jgi:quercetin dioxygenase-like cupin family protein